MKEYRERKLDLKRAARPMNSNTNMPRILILGTGAISRSQIRILGLLNYGIIVVDDQYETLEQLNFPLSDQVICGEFKDVIKSISLDINDAAIICTGDSMKDLECLRILLNEPVDYIGLMGNPNKLNEMMATLELEGTDWRKFSRIYAPAGLSIGAKTPDEVAFSIGAEIISVNRNHYGIREEESLLEII
ncbi:MAG: XdhC family protein [Candidatus Saccharibacteria bacterium]